MIRTFQRRFAVGVLLPMLMLATSCSSGGPEPAPTATPAATASPSSTSAPNPTPLASNVPVPEPDAVSLSGIGQTTTVLVTEGGYTGNFTVAAPQCALVAAVDQQQTTSTYTIAATGVGSCVATFSDAFGRSGTLGIGVTVTNFGGS